MLKGKKILIVLLTIIIVLPLTSPFCCCNAIADQTNSKTNNNCSHSQSFCKSAQIISDLQKQNDPNFLYLRLWSQNSKLFSVSKSNIGDAVTISSMHIPQKILSSPEPLYLLVLALRL